MITSEITHLPQGRGAKQNNKGQSKMKMKKDETNGKLVDIMELYSILSTTGLDVSLQKDNINELHSSLKELAKDHGYSF